MFGFLFLVFVIPFDGIICLLRRFHVDKMSSAHVYVRLHKGQTIDDINEGLLEDCAQLVKANSIQGKSLTDCNSLGANCMYDVPQQVYDVPQQVYK